MKDVIPYVKKPTATIIVIASDLEAIALRAVLEALNYRITMHWIGSKEELLKIINGDIPNDDLVFLCCHGEGDGIYMPDEDNLTFQEIRNQARFSNNIVVNLGCNTATSELSDAFKLTGVKNYIAADGYPDGSATLVFANIFSYIYNLTGDVNLSLHKANSIDKETSLFIKSF